MIELPFSKRLPVWACLLVLCFVVLAPAPAAAVGPAEDSERRVAILPAIDYGGDKAAAFTDELEVALREGIGRGALVVIPAGDIRPLLDAKGKCGEECLGRVFEETSAWMVVRPRARARDRTYEVELDATATATGESAVSVAETCEICGKQEVVRTFADLGAALAQGLEARSAARPVLSIQTQPSGARVLIDGEHVGTSPLEVEVDPGTHEVAVELVGHIRQTQVLESVAGVRAAVQLNLQPVNVDPEEQARLARRSKTFIAAGAASAGLGVLSIGIGIPLLIIDSTPIERNCSGLNVDENGTCRFSHDTLSGGIAGLTLGGTALVAGAVLVVLGVRARPAATKAARVQPTANGLRLSF